ncbi:MAG: carbamate kinase [Patescibacteria group bacterium]
MARLAVVAVGGNALIRDAGHQSIPDQCVAAAAACGQIAAMVARGWQIVLTHGNGPQVGFIQRRAELALSELPPVPLDHCGAASQGDIGYILQRALGNELRKRGCRRQVVSLVTQTLVQRDDPAFANPTKPIGSFMDAAVARRRGEEEGWQVGEDAGRGWRRMVPSPLPRRIVELDVIRTLVRAGAIVICLGGGGIPVCENEAGELEGLEAVIDKDRASSLLARGLRADLFLITTGVEKVALRYNQPGETWLDRLTLAEARRLLGEGHFPPGSMGPKIEAAVGYLESGGREVLITSPDSLARALRGETGTRITA